MSTTQVIARSRVGVVALALGFIACSSQAGSPDTGVDQAGITDYALDARADTTPRVDAAPRVATNPLNGIVLSDDTSDLAPLAPIVAQAEVVGIGESVHTAGGQLHMRTRLIQYLVSSQKFRLLAFESERTPVALLLEPYLQSCAGAAEDASAINPIWWDESTPAILRWLCQWNASHPGDRVHGVGFDIHQPWYDYPSVKSYLESVAPAEAAKLPDGVYRCLGAKYASQEAFFADPTNLAYYNGDGVHVVPQADHDACQAGASATLSYLESQRPALVAASERSFELARLALVGMQAYDITIYKLSRGILYNGPRDQAMFDVFRTMRRLDHPGARAIVWAHNGHIVQRSDEVLNSQWTGVKNMGTLIAADLGGRYAAIGQTAATIHINWAEGAQTITAPSTSLEAGLDQLKQPLLLLDLLAATTGGAPLLTPDKKLPVGIDVSYPAAVPARHFDALVFQHECPGPKYFKSPPWFKGY